MSDAASNSGKGDIPLVVAVVLTWNDTELTSRCLRSVFDNDYPSLRVVLVDNGSVPPRGAELKAAFPDIELLTLPENRGFSGGANRGIDRALEMEADYVHLIGNDSTLAPNVISKIVMECEQRADVGAASPIILFPGEKKTVEFYTAHVDRDTARHLHDHVGQPLDSREWPTIETEFIPCVATLFRAETLRQVGMFDESFGTSYEDYDLCLRIGDAGWKCITVGQAVAVHLGSQTTGGDNPYITYYTVRNHLICIHRYGSPAVWLRRGPFILRMLYWQIRRYGYWNWACHWAFLKGVLHFLFGIRGERNSKHMKIPPGKKDATPARRC